MGKRKNARHIAPSVLVLGEASQAFPEIVEILDNDSGTLLDLIQRTLYQLQKDLVIMDEMEKSDDMLVPLSEGIEKNLAKAAWKLSAGLLNIPLQAIERHLSEKKSESDARIMVTQTVAQRISEQLDVPEEYVTLAVAKSFGNIVQEQLNLDSVFEKTQQSLQNTPQDETQADRNIEEISDDWLNQFREFACQKSSEEAQDLFSKVLEGEIRKPGSFSLQRYGHSQLIARGLLVLGMLRDRHLSNMKF